MNSPHAMNDPRAIMTRCAMRRGARCFTLIDRGFTLIEMMIAIVVLGFILVMLAESFHAVAGSKVHGENRLAVDQAGRTILMEMSDELRGAVQTPIIASRVVLIGEARMGGGQAMDSVTVSTLDPGHRRSLEGFGPEDTVSYFTAPNRDHPGWYLLERMQNSSLLTNPPSAGSDNTVILANNLLALHIRYYDGQTYSESWNSSSLPPGQELPVQVTIELEMASAGGAPLTLATAVMLPMAFAQW
jgi:prepilin-type N-terminal cleavage/methylation domain-containing protein